MKEIAGYEGLYSIDKEGNVFGHKRQNYISFKSRNCRYFHLNLCKDGIKKTFLVHRLVALAYIPNPDNKLQVNHINGLKHDNRAENLEWVSGKKNMEHACAVGLIGPRWGTKREKHWAEGKPAHNRKPVKNVTTGEIFDSINEASIKLNLKRQCIIDCLNGRQKTSGGFAFERVTTDEARPSKPLNG